MALIVIGPERLPKVARTVGHLLGRLQRYVGDVKSDISREMQLEDLKKLQQQVADQAKSMEQLGQRPAEVGRDARSTSPSPRASSRQGAPTEPLADAGCRTAAADSGRTADKPKA